MITSLSMKNFKCFNDNVFNTKRLTILTGMNSTGKSTIIQALALLHQDISESENSEYLCQNGQIFEFGDKSDIINRYFGKNEFSIGIECTEKEEINFVYDETQKLFKKILKNKINCKAYDAMSEACKRFLRQCTFLGANRLGPQAMHQMRSGPIYDGVGYHGERTIQILLNNDEKEVDEGKLCPEGPPTLRKQTEFWFNKFFPNVNLDIKPVELTNVATLGISARGVGFLRPQNTGFGLSSVLPVIVAGLYVNDNNLLAIENPEIHLHPKGQSEIGHFLAKVAATDGQIIIETHSDHVLNGIRRAVKDGTISYSDVIIYFFDDMSDDGKPNAQELEISKDGSIEYWPTGFFDQLDKDLTQLIAI